jgi:hypothetical protein
MNRDAHIKECGWIGEKSEFREDGIWNNRWERQE